MRLGGISMGAGRGILSVVFRMGQSMNVCERALVFRIEGLEEWVIWSMKVLLIWLWLDRPNV
jgi:hypothetical protein